MQDDNRIPAVRKQLLSIIKAVVQREDCSLNDAAGRVLAEAVNAPRDLPSADLSLFDGYAFAGPVVATDSLPVAGVQYAGDAPSQLVPGTAMRIFTGALLPAGADTVVAQEAVRASAERIRFHDSLLNGAGVRKQGADTRAGTCLLPAGHRISGRDIGLIASTGLDQLTVFRQVKVALLTTGDELLAPGERWSPGKIFDANGPLLETLLKRADVTIVYRARLKDQAAEIDQALARAADADLIISSGGVSVGDADLVRDAVERAGRLDHWRVFLKPGKPLAVGRVDQTPFVGLPGNPVSTFVTCLLFVYPALSKLAGQTDKLIPKGYVVPLAEPVAGGDRPEFIRVQHCSETGALHPFTDQNSGLLSSLSWADGLAYIPERARLSVGDTVTFYAFSGWGL